jgi:phospholipase C
VIVHLRNPGAGHMEVAVVDNGYKTQARYIHVEPGGRGSIVLNLVQSHQWYDFTVKTKGTEAEAHFAGKLETGRAGFTDPLMGG